MAKCFEICTVFAGSRSAPFWYRPCSGSTVEAGVFGRGRRQAKAACPKSRPGLDSSSNHCDARNKSQRSALVAARNNGSQGVPRICFSRIYGGPWFA
jgi:hypothetical protein